MEVTGLDIRVQPRQDNAQVPEKSSKLTQEAARELTRLYGQLPDSELKDTVGKMLGRGSG
jgi:hypothetical protein